MIKLKLAYIVNRTWHGDAETYLLPCTPARKESHELTYTSAQAAPRRLMLNVTPELPAVQLVPERNHIAILTNKNKLTEPYYA